MSARTRRRLTDALDEAVEHDGELAARLREVLGETAASTSAKASAGGDGIAVAGDVDIHAEGGSAAALRMGDVTIGNPPVPGSPQG